MFPQLSGGLAEQKYDLARDKKDPAEQKYDPARNKKDLAEQKYDPAGNKKDPAEASGEVISLRKSKDLFGLQRYLESNDHFPISGQD